MPNDFSKKQKKFQRKSSLACRTAKQIANQLVTLQGQLKQSIKLIKNYDQAKLTLNIWCNNPTLNEKDLGNFEILIFFEIKSIIYVIFLIKFYISALKAAWVIIEEAKKCALTQTEMDSRDEFLITIHECESIVKNLEKLSLEFNTSRQNSDKNELMATQEKKSLISRLGGTLQEKLNILEFKITRALVEQVANDFLDINQPLRRLNELIQSSSGKYNYNLFKLKHKSLLVVIYLVKTMANLQEKFDNCSNDFLTHTKKICNTAQQLALSTTQCKNRQTIALISELAKRVNNLV